MEERDKKKMDQLKKKLHTDDEGLIYAFSICTVRKQFVDKWVFMFIYCFEIGNWSFMFKLQGMLKRKLVYFKIKIIFSWDLHV